MVRRGILRESRLVHAALGATLVAGPASAALADGPHPAASLEAHLKAHRLHYGQAAVVYGQAPVSDAGRSVTLEFAPAGRTAWQSVASAPIRPDGAFRLSAPLRSSGSVMVTTSAASGSPSAAAVAGANTTSTVPQHVAVAARLRLRRRTRTVLGAQTIDVRGQLLPRGVNHRILLQAHSGRRWITLATARTRAGGWFKVRYRATVPGREPLRVRFAGDRSNGASAASAGWLTVLHPSLASWYYDGGTTACGFHAYYGVANLSLPCGSRVTLSYGGRRVVAVVDDRGPYVGGREWDLNQNTAAALGFGGVDTVWASR